MRRLGRRNARQSVGLSAMARLDNTIHALVPYSWMRADSYTVDGVSGKVASFPDIVRPGTGIRAITAAHAFAQATSASQAVVPAAHSALGSRLAANFAAAPYYVSNSPASSWRAVHNGSGWTSFAVLDRTSVAGSQFHWSTFGPGAETGGGASIQGGILYRQVYNSTTQVCVAGGAGEATGATYVSDTFNSSDTPDLTVYRKSASVATANLTGAVDTGDSAGTMTIGANRSGSNLLNAYLAEELFFNRSLTAGEYTIVRAYFTARYGVT